MKWDEIQHYLEPDNIGTAPTIIKGSVCAFLFAALVGAGIYFDTTEQLTVLERHERTELELKDDFKIKA
jgi:Tfp pilus assembly protein PilO